jgi:hypothetical protein
MKEIIGVLIGFAPWIAFGLISGPSIAQVSAGIITAFILSLVTGAKDLARGFVLTWGSFIFFGINIVLIVILKNQWVLKNLDIMSHGTLATIAWLSVIIGKPFVLQYARQTTPPEKHSSPVFYRICRDLSMLWGIIFLINTLMSLAKARGWISGGMGSQAVSLGLMFLGLWLNHAYPKFVVGRVKKSESESGNPAP